MKINLPKFKLKRFFLELIPLFIIFIAVMIYADSKMKSESEDRIFDEIDKLPHKRAALVLGCSPLNGNLYFRTRINAAARIFNAGKCDYLIVSGDNSRKDYDEPTAMKNALINAGIPDSAIYRDYAGFRTLDSVVRTKAIFSQNDVIIVSQKFHLERALYIAKRRKINAVGYKADDVRHSVNRYTLMREKAARLVALLDSIRKKKPKYYGSKVILGKGDIEP